ncbi:MAG: hypothetical protein ACUVSF_04155 [Anaerolineae bacterium]
MIRPFRLWDVALVARLQREGVSLDLETRLTWPHSPLGMALISHLLPARDGMHTCIVDHKEENGGSYGLAQMRQRPGRNEYMITFMAPALSSGSGAHAIWQRLLNHLAVHTGEQGGQRLYAGLPDEGEEYQVFRHAGFVAYAQEIVYRCASLPPLPPSSPLTLRPQCERDSWGLQQLYAAATPRAVQTAEGSGQGEWELLRQRWLTQPWRRGYVWECAGEIRAALQVRSTPTAHWIRLLCHPDDLDQMDALVVAALMKVLKGNRNRSVLWAVRTYEPGLAAVLSEYGFVPAASQTLVVKYCTVWARELALHPVTTLNGKAEQAAPTVKYHYE